MATEVKEEKYVKLNKEDVGGHLFTFYASGNAIKAAECWKNKSVSFKSPKSGKIYRQNNNDEKCSSKPEGKASERFSINKITRLFDDLKRPKVADFEYQQSKVRQGSLYKPFWATKVVHAFRKTEKVSRDPEEGHSHVIVNKKIMFQLESGPTNFSKEPVAGVRKIPPVERNAFVTKNVVKGYIGSPKVVLTKYVKKSPRKLSTVILHHEHRLAMPPYYKGSKLFMPTGEQMFWVRC